MRIGWLISAAALLASLSLPAWAQTGGVCATRPGADDLPGIYAFVRQGCPAALGWPADAGIRMTGPTPDSTGSVHGYVSNYYAPEVYEWMKAGRPANGIPPSAYIVKQMYNTDARNRPTTVSGWAVMVKAQGKSFDDWMWIYVDPKSDEGSAGRLFDPTCTNCHGSADNRELTFASLDFGAKPGTPTAAVSAERSRKPTSGHGLHSLLDLFKHSPCSHAPGGCLPPQNDDHVVVPAGGPTGFITSENCGGCHDASGTRFATPPAMGLPEGKKMLNVSPFGEWSTSMMALSGRDPVFQAQLESEKTLHPELAPFLDNLCYGCHGAMGQRQFHLDGKGPYFTHETFLATSGPDQPYGALGRDGISCTLCHRITPEGLGTEASFTGRFKIADAATIFGPYADPNTYPMKNTLGMTPMAGTAIADPALCGSCHVVQTPILNVGVRYTPEEAEAAPKSHEQTTYLEWLNSAFPARQETCQSCHMPRIAGTGNQAIKTRIANIEDQRFVDAEGKPFPHTAPAAEITLAERQPFSRHTLVGVNVNTLEFFRQFPDELGRRTSDGNLDTSTFDWISSMDLTVRESVALAQSRTASVRIAGQRRSRDGLAVTVEVGNQAGHKLPSGVGFRRAFIEFVAADKAGRTVWSSGRTNHRGQVVDGRGNVIATELGDTVWEPHHAEIGREDQVQVYEARHTDSAGKLTDSFVSLKTIVKDNRLMPAGWSKTGAYAGWTEPVAVDPATDPEYFDGRGLDRLVYRIPRAVAARVAKVTATLYYQSLPPRYLAERERVSGAGVNTRRLMWFVGNLDERKTALKDRKLRIAGASAAAP